MSIKGISQRCKVQGCKAKATHIRPAPLCFKHWQWWWYYPSDDSDYALKEVLSGKHVSFTLDIRERIKLIGGDGGQEP